MDETSTLKSWLESIYTAHGILTPELVREAARPKDSIGHAHVFNVPSGEAAEQYYLTRAHTLIQRVKVTIVAQGGGEPRRVRYYHAVPGEEATFVYEPLNVIQQSPTKLAAARTEAMRRLRDAEHSLEDLDVIASTSATAKAVKSVRRARELITA